MFNLIKKCIIQGSNTLSALNKIQIQQVRTRYINWQMRKDVRKRNTVIEYNSLRIRLTAITKGKMLPGTIRDHTHRYFKDLPEDIRPTRTKNRCIITSRPRGVVGSHRLSRIMFRLLADYNKLSGVIRAKW